MPGGGGGGRASSRGPRENAGSAAEAHLPPLGEAPWVTQWVFSHWGVCTYRAPCRRRLKGLFAKGLAVARSTLRPMRRMNKFQLVG